MVNELLLALGQSDVEVQRISDERAIRRHITLNEIPGLVINGQLASTRELPPREMLLNWLQQATQQEDTTPA
jgi:hypothetical protein